jgi:uncharacterized protein (DUF2267 family)
VSHDEFVQKVQERAGLDDRAEAERTAVEVLQDLCDRLTGDEAWDLLATLPAKLKTAVIISPNPIPLSAEQFVDRVASELDVAPDEARKRIRAVFQTVREAIPLGELDDVLAQLDPEYADLIA